MPPSYDRDFWQSLWEKTLREHAQKVASRPPNADLVAMAEALRPGRALDAGCGHGAEALWLAARGFEVTAVDFSSAALDHLRSVATGADPAITQRLTLVLADLASFSPEPNGFELVSSLYVHVAGSVEAMVRRLASGVAPGGTLLLIGHQPVDPATGAATSAAGQTQVSVQAAQAALPATEWTLLMAEERQRSTGGGVDAVICARRL